LNQKETDIKAPTKGKYHKRVWRDIYKKMEEFREMNQGSGWNVYLWSLKPLVKHESNKL
jgi:hypothetical protein